MLRDELLTGVRLWGVRRVPVVELAVLTGAVAAFGLLWLWNPLVAACATAAGLVVQVRHGRDSKPVVAVPPGAGWLFGGERLAYRPISEVLEATPREITGRLSARYGATARVDLVLWIVASDKTGQPWTLVQDRFDDELSSITATAVGRVPGACDPYLESQRLALRETGFPLMDVIVVGWGSDSSLGPPRETILVIGRTGAGAEELGSHHYEGGRRRSHLVELHPDPVARTLGQVDARRWHAAAAHGLVRSMELLYPGSGPLLDELVTVPWRNRRMFRRLDRLTEGSSEQSGPVAEHPVVLRVVDGGLSEERETRPPIAPIGRALSWEQSPRAIPTRYPSRFVPRRG